MPLAKTNLKELNANEKDVPDKVIEQMSDWSAAAISTYSYNDMPWKVYKDGEDINFLE